MKNFNNYLIKQLNEGLISTHLISQYSNILLDNINLQFNNKLHFNININFNNETFILQIYENISYENFEKINSLCNNLGYFISKYTVFRNNIKNTFRYDNNIEKNIKTNIGLFIYYESKFDTEIIPPDTLYHATNIKNYLKIDKNGLYPKSASKLKYHLDRIYFSISLQNCENLIPKLRNFDITNTTNIKDYIILEINTIDFNQKNFDNTMTNVKFRENPNSNGIYTYNNIPKDRLNIIKNIYTTNNIISFDYIESTQNKIKAYHNNTVVYDKNII